MEIENQFRHIAFLLGDQARSVMLWNLLDGKAYTATELSLCANISPQSASNHLLKLVGANILSVERQGRHRYYKFANENIAHVIESMASLLPLSNELKKNKRPEGNGMTYARTCYDHIAGKLGVDITDSFIKKGIIKSTEKIYMVTDHGKVWFKSVGINVDETKLQKRSFAHQCLDWSERRHHLAGALGASLLQTMLKQDWIRKMKNSREIVITSKGIIELKRRLNLEI